MKKEQNVVKTLCILKFHLNLCHKLSYSDKKHPILGQIMVKIIPTISQDNV